MQLGRALLLHSQIKPSNFFPLARPRFNLVKFLRTGLFYNLALGLCEANGLQNNKVEKKKKIQGRESVLKWERAKIL